jgi:hypothetical protein
MDFSTIFGVSFDLWLSALKKEQVLEYLFVECYLFDAVKNLSSYLDWKRK